MLKFSEIFEFSRENSYFERIRMVRMVRSLADRTFQLWGELEGHFPVAGILVQDLFCRSFAALLGRQKIAALLEQERAVTYRELLLRGLRRVDLWVANKDWG